MGYGSRKYKNYYQEVERGIFNCMQGRKDIVFSVKSTVVYHINDRNKATKIGYYIDDNLIKKEKGGNLILNGSIYNYIENCPLNFRDDDLKLGKPGYVEETIIEYFGYAEIVSFDGGITLEWVI